MHGLDEIKTLTDKIDRKALTGAVGIMLLSWAGLPLVYWLIARKNVKEKEEVKKEK
jgi:hypothetical protein